MFLFFKFFFKFYFKWTGWKVCGDLPEDVSKAVLIGGAHTSNWDLVYSLGAMFTLDRKFRFLIKKEALVFPLRSFLMALGALPVDRSPQTKHRYVDQLAQVFSENEEIFLCMAPEGTRKPVKKWKTGFYHISQKAQVPIIVCYLDYQKKEAHIGKALDLNISEEQTVLESKQVLQKASPWIPENFIN